MNEISLGDVIGKRDKEFMESKNKMKDLDKLFKKKQRELKEIFKKGNNPYLEKLVKQNNDILMKHINNCEQKCDALGNLLKHITSIPSSNIMTDKIDEKLILKEYDFIKAELEELTELLID